MAGNNISTILNSTMLDTNIRRVRTVQDGYNKINNKIMLQDYSRYDNLESLESSGLSTSFYRLQRDLANIEAYKHVSTKTTLKLDTQAEVLENIRSVIQNLPVKLQAQGADLESLCNESLKKIEDLLNTRSDSGEYLFGGTNSYRQACKDLIANSNLEGDNSDIINTNYTDATENLINISVSKQHNIVFGLDASNDAFAKTIGYINLLKKHKDDANSINAALEDDKAEKARTNALEQLMTLRANVGLKKEVTVTAQKYNQDLAVDIDAELTSTFRFSEAEIAGYFKASMLNVSLSYQALNSNNRLLERLLQMG